LFVCLFICLFVSCEDLSQEEYAKCLETVKAVIGQLDCCSDTNDRHHVELRSTAYSYIGNSQFEMDDCQQALKYHKKDYDLAKKQYVL